MMSDDENEQMGPALIVGDADDQFDLDIPPTSGAEYLRRVQMEAQTCPEIVVAKIDRSAYRHRQTVKVQGASSLLPAPSGYAPSLAWQKHQTAEFSKVRQDMCRLLQDKASQKKSSVKIPKRDDVQGWCQLCFGKLQPRGAKRARAATAQPVVEDSNTDTETDDQANTSAEPTDEGTPPLLSLMVQMDQHTVHKVLEYHINWFEATGFTVAQGRWLYALLTCLEKPLTPEVCSLLRSLARNCANLRATIESPEDQNLISLNLLICLVARYFDQMDLADNNG